MRKSFCRFPLRGPAGSTYTELKAALNLTDAQIQQLLQLQTNYIQSNQTLYNQLSEQQRILNQQLFSDTPDAVAAGAAVGGHLRCETAVDDGREEFRDSGRLQGTSDSVSRLLQEDYCNIL